MKAEDVIRIANSYIGKTETPNNSGFKDAVFQKKMEQVGWIKSAAWCSYLAELIFKEAAGDDKVMFDMLGRLFSGSATATFKNFDLDKTFATGKIPKLGALVIWRHGVGWQGHTGTVVEVIDKDTFRSVEGNTNDVGGREGYIVAKKTRLANKPFSAKGLNLVGFVYLCT